MKIYLIEKCKQRFFLRFFSTQKHRLQYDASIFSHDVSNDQVVEKIQAINKSNDYLEDGWVPTKNCGCWLQTKVIETFQGENNRTSEKIEIFQILRKKNWDPIFIPLWRSLIMNPVKYQLFFTSKTLSNHLAENWQVASKLP